MSKLRCLWRLTEECICTCWDKRTKGDPLLMRNDPLLQVVLWRDARKWRYRKFGKDSKKAPRSAFYQIFGSRKEKKEDNKMKFKADLKIWTTKSGTKGKLRMSRPWRATSRDERWKSPQDTTKVMLRAKGIQRPPSCPSQDWNPMINYHEAGGVVARSDEEAKKVVRVFREG